MNFLLLLPPPRGHVSLPLLGHLAETEQDEYVFHILRGKIHAFHKVILRHKELNLGAERDLRDHAALW